MKDFDQILDDCLVQISSGASTLDDCLARHPEHAAQLKPLLLTASRLERGRDVCPPAAFKARARARLTLHMQVHPRQRQSAFPFMRLAVSMAVLVLTFLVTGTALAQSALPGDALYSWKLASEEAWRTIAPDPLAVDLSLSERRVDEMLAVSGDPSAYAAALSGYREVLTRLTVQTDAQTRARIEAALSAQQEMLASAGLSLPELNEYLGSLEQVVPTPTPLPLPTVIPTALPPAISTAVPSIIPTLLPTVAVPTAPLPTLPLPLPTISFP